MTEEELSADHDNEGDDGKEKKAGKGKPKGKVKQAKIVRENGRVDVKTGLGKSKGYGFLEMRAHADSLRVLRWANNNPELRGMWATWEKEAKELAEKAKGKKAETKEEEGTKAEGTKAKAAKEKDQQEEDRETKGTLIVEFSIENVQVVQRRAAKEDAARSSKVCSLLISYVAHTADASSHRARRNLTNLAKDLLYQNVKRTIALRERSGEWGLLVSVHHNRRSTKVKVKAKYIYVEKGPRDGMCAPTRGVHRRPDGRALLEKDGLPARV